jgi:hypothetical protein
MRHLCLIGHQDDPTHPLPKGEADALIQEHLAFEESIKRSGHFVSAGALDRGAPRGRGAPVTARCR